jgi:carbohydrate ABC transporter membrane protein 2, CUT1 family (TC 3.A.1.1.-)
MTRTIPKLGFLIAYVALLTFLLFPLVWIVMMSLKGYDDVIAYPPTFLFAPRWRTTSQCCSVTPPP